MKFVCDRCQTKYSIADEKVRGKILKVRCKACTNIITVREEPVAGAPARRPSSAALRTLESTNPAPVAPAARPPAPPAMRAPAPRAVVHEDSVQWYMALDGDRSGPFSRKHLLDKIAPLPSDADLHVWNEQLGDWKPPGQVPDIAAELQMRRRPPGPPPFPGAPRRPTPPPIPALAASPTRPTGAHAVAAAIGPGVGLKLPPPSGPPTGRRITGPIPRPSGLGASDGLAPAASPHDGRAHVDPSTLLQTPAPQLHMLHGLAGSNGLGAAHSADAPARNGTPAPADRSDALNTLNLAAAAASTSGGSPRLLSSEAVVDWQPDAAQTPAARQRSARIVVAFLCVIALICVVFMLNVTKKPQATMAPAPTKTAAGADPLAGVTEKPAETRPAVGIVPIPPEPSAAVETFVAPERGSHGKGKGKTHGAHGHSGNPLTVASATSPPGQVSSPAAGSSKPVAENTANARYRDTSRPGLAINGGGGSSRPGPSQSEISRVIGNNRGGIKNCYQRALLRDSSLTHGKITVGVTIGISGRVKHVGIDGPPQFRSLDPCIKELVGRWVFPQAGDEYGTEFVYVFQGNE